MALVMRLVLMPDYLRYDELLHYMVVQSPLVPDFVRESRSLDHPPLVYLLMKPFVAISASVYSVRAVSLLCGMISIVLSYSLLRRILGSYRGVQLGTLLFAFAPILVQQSIQARHYSLALAFIWGALLIWIRIIESKTPRLRDHALLTLLQIASLASYYGSVFFVVALSLSLYVPLAIKLGRRGEWGVWLRAASPQLVIAGLGVVFFFTVLRGRLPKVSTSHAGGAVFYGELSNPAALLAFVFEQLPNFMQATLPGGWGILILVLIPLPFAPVFSRDPLAPICRSISSCALLGIALIAGASLVNLYPFGGIPRHAAPLVPVLIVAAYLAVSLVLREFTKPGSLRSLSISVLLFCVILGTAQGLLPGFSSRTEYQSIANRLHVDAYRSSGSPLVVNVGGRAFASWWFLRGRTLRLIDGLGQNANFDYEGISVTMTESPDRMLAKAVSEASRTGESWILHTKFSGHDQAHFVRATRRLEASLRTSTEIRVAKVGRIDSFPFLATYQLVAVTGGSSPPRSSRTRSIK